MHTKVKWYNSISTHLLKWFLLLSLIPILIISVLSYKNSSQSLYNMTESYLKDSGLSHISFVENWFYYRTIDIKLWSDDKNTVDFMHALDKGFKTSNLTAQAYINSSTYQRLEASYQENLLALPKHYDYIYDVFLINLQGDILYTVVKESDLGKNLHEGIYASSLFARAVSATSLDKKIHFSDLERHISSGQTDVYGFLTSPVFNDRQELIGIFAIQFKPERIYAQFQKANQDKDGISHYLLGGEDLTLRTAINDSSEILKRRVQTKQTELYQSEHVYAHKKTHKEAGMDYTGPDGLTIVIGEHHPIDILGVKWVLISEMNKDTVLAPAYELASKVLIITFAVILVTLIISVFVARHITKPINSLALASESVTRGGERTPVWIEEKNEISQFADAFNDMVEELTAKEKSILEYSEGLQRALHDLREQKLALDAHSIVAITDIQGTITYVNKKFTQISGYNEDEILGQNHRILNSGTHSLEFWKGMFDKISRGEVWHDEVCNKAKDGSFYWVDTTIVPFADEGKKLTSYIAIRTDITEQKAHRDLLIKAKEDAEQGARSKSEFLASMSHEIRTPMNGVIGMLGLLKNSQLTQSQHHQVSLAQSSANSLLTLINDILDFSKVEAGKLELEELQFNLRDDLGNFAEAIGYRAQENNIELILDVKKVEQALIVSDPGRLRQILTNLVGNSIKFTHDGEILITCELRPEDDARGRLYVTIKDSGIGISQDKISTLFDPFTQVDSSTTRRYGGTGLGLSIVKQLVELMGGSIRVESELGKGSTFSFDINVGLPKQTDLVIPRVPVKGVRVLIIDDNSINREVLREQLLHWEMVVYEAEDGDKALKLCQEHLSKSDAPPFDIALIDMHMPYMDGAELAKRLRSVRAYDKMKMVMMTSLGSRNEAKVFFELGFNAYFPKPTTTQDLFNALNVLIEDADTLQQSGNFLTTDNLRAMTEPDSMIPWPKETRILLVEDNMTNQIVANGILETFGLQADVANNGEEAIHALKQAYKSTPYTLVLMDCQMPTMDGYTATEKIRQGAAGDENIKIPIIAMTANAMKGDREHCISVGMDDYLSKPISPDTLNAVLEKWLKKKSTPEATGHINEESIKPS